MEFIEEHASLVRWYVICAALSYILMTVVAPLVFNKIGGIDLKQKIWHILVPIAFMWLVLVALYCIKIFLSHNLIPNLVSFLKKRLFELYLEKHESHFNESEVTAHMTQLFDVVENIKSLFIWMIDTVMPMSILMVCVNLYLFYASPGLGVLNLIANSIIVCYVKSVIQSINEILSKQQHQFLNLVGNIDEKFSNLMNIYLNDKIKDSVEEYMDIDNEYTMQCKENNKKVQISIFTVRSIMYSYAGIAILYMYWSLLQDKIEQSEVVSTVIIIFFYCSTIDILADRTLVTSKEITTILASDHLFKKEITEETKSPFSNEMGEIECTDLVFYYRKDNPILNQCTFHIKSDEKVALLGKTGSGKSTLVKLILGFYRIQEGTIKINGQDINTIDLKELRKHIHYINQKTNLFHESILNNMKYGNHSTDEQVIALLKQYNLIDIFGDESQLQRMVEKHGSNISAGMQKVIIVVRGILHPCKVLIMDEPFTSIDTKTRNNILQLIKNETVGKTLLIITHDMNGLDQVMDRCINMLDLNHIEK